ncbi:MAG: S8 family peptidase [Ghiorsea sp.]
MMRLLVSFLFMLVASLPLQAMAQSVNMPVYGTGLDILIQFKAKTNQNVQNKMLQDSKVANVRSFKAAGGIQHWQLEMPMDAAEVINKLKAHPDIEFIEPNYRRYMRVVPDDIHFDKQWGMHNVGQFVGSVPNIDMQLPAAWDIQPGSPTVVVAVIDDSIDINHEDLYANIWTNMGENPNNGQDDDGNGYADDLHGWDFVNNDNDPSADVGKGEGHGTMVAGCIGAVGNNVLGVSGVNWNVSIMPLKFLGDVASELAAIDYAIANGAHIVNASWGGPQFSYAESAGMQKLLNAGILLVAAAGNNNVNNDKVLDYPSSLPYANILAVSAMQPDGRLTSWSHYGATTVDVAAPGHTIYTTTSDTTGPLYDYTSGTSFSAPLTAGVAALVKAQYPGATYQELKGRLMASSTKLGQHGLSATDGMVNADLALRIAPRPELVIADLALKDSNNNLIDPNESLQLNITLENVWQAATGINGTLSTTDSLVTMTKSTSTWANLSIGGKATASFTFSTGEINGFREIPFVLDLITTEGATFKRFFTLNSGTLIPDVSYQGTTMTHDQAEFQYYHVDVAAGTPLLNIQTTADADIDILVRYGAEPLFDYALYGINPIFGRDKDSLISAQPSTGNEQVLVENPQAGTWHIIVISFDQKAATYTVKAGSSLDLTRSGGGSSGLCLSNTWLFVPSTWLMLLVILALSMRRRK